MALKGRLNQFMDEERGLLWAMTNLDDKVELPYPEAG